MDSVLFEDPLQFWEPYLSCVKTAGTVSIRDKSQLTLKLERISKDGLSNLQVISDFDGTCTSHFNSVGKRCLSCHGVIGKYGKFPDSYRAEVERMESVFGPREKDPRISEEERLQLMHDWWAQSHALMIAQKISLILVEEMVIDAVYQKNLFGLRTDFRSFVFALRSSDVPLVVLSAGICIVIEELFKLEKIPSDDKTLIVSNQTIADDNGVLTAFVEPVLHGMSKKHVLKNVINDSAHRQKRHNYIVVGDMPHDHEVVDLVDDVKEKLTIAFLSDKAHLQDYMAIYDIVLVDDQGFEFISRLFGGIKMRAGIHTNPLCK
jgi:HAD superfamily hydrolase (TIGR01544 family)